VDSCQAPGRPAPNAIRYDTKHAYPQPTFDGPEQQQVLQARQLLPQPVKLPPREVARGGGPPPPPKFRADHPFIFLILDTRTGSVLFLGRLLDPAS